MAPSVLRQFISLLEADGELSPVAVAVDPLLEIAAITDRVCKQPGGGKALLFEHPAGSHFPVTTNLFGSTQRVCRALGIIDLSELTVRLSTLLDRIPELDIKSLDRQIASLSEFRSFAPDASLEPDPALVRMNPPDLTRFPFLQSWPGDGKASGHPRYITLPQVITADPDGDTCNCGILPDPAARGACSCHPVEGGSGAARHAELYRRNGKAMPVAVVLGGDPATLFSAMFPLPGDLDELTFAGFLRGTPLVTVPCRSVPLRVPDGAEVVIEGYVEPGETVSEGPFGNHTGFYAPAAPASLLRVTGISHRPDAVIPATVVGPPPMEDCWMAQAWERLLLAFLRRLVPAVVDIHFPLEWVFHQSAVISLVNPAPGMVRETTELLWSFPWFGMARLLVFVDADTGPAYLSRVAWRSINLAAPGIDLFHDAAGTRSALDATGCTMERQPVVPDGRVSERVARRWREYGI